MIQPAILELKQQEDKLHTSLDNLRGDRKKLRDYKNCDRELQEIISRRKNLEAAAKLHEGMLVSRPDSEKTGIVDVVAITPGGHVEIWVRWFSFAAASVNHCILRTMLVAEAPPDITAQFIAASFVGGFTPYPEQPKLLLQICSLQDTIFLEEEETAKAVLPQDTNPSGQLNGISTPQPSTEEDFPKPELLKPTQQNLPTNSSIPSKPQTYLSLAALVRICPPLGKEQGLMVIAQNCFLRQSDFFDSNSLRLSYLKMLLDCSPATTEVTLSKSSAPSLNWGIWGVGNLAMENNGLPKIESESFLWVLTGNLQCNAISANRPTLLQCLDSGDAIVHCSPAGKRIYTDLAPTLRSLGTSNGKQGGSGAWKVREEDGTIRPLAPVECERLMGWKPRSTEFGITADGEEILISNTQRHKMLGNGIIPAEIEDLCNNLKPILEAMKQSNVIDSQPKVDNQTNYGMMEELLPAESLATGGGIEPNTTQVPAMDHHTISGTVVAANFKIGDRVKSNFPFFLNQICTIVALPSNDAAIVELEDGARERVLLKNLLPLKESEIEFPVTRFGVIEELSPDEEKERHRLELKVERAFYEAGCALRDLRDKRLYRSAHKTFEEYCQDRFGHSRQKSNYLIGAADVYKNLTTNCCQNLADDLATNRTQILPTNEGQVRPLTKLQPEEQRTCWQQAVDLADGKIPTGKIVKGVVERLKEKPLVLAKDFCDVGDIFILKKLEGEEHKYNRCWAIVVDTSGINVKINFYNGTLSVKPENLDKLDSPDAQRELPQVLARIRRLRAHSDSLDRVVLSLLEHFGKHHYLTPLEDKILKTMEQEYGVVVDTKEE